MTQFHKQLISMGTETLIKAQKLVFKTASSLQEIVIPKSAPKCPSNHSFKNEHYQFYSNKVVND